MLKVQPYLALLLVLVPVVGRAEEPVSRTGLAVVVGSHDGAAELELLKRSSIVLGFASDEAQRDAARKTLFEAGVYGRASVRLSIGGRLPLVDGVVNHLVLLPESDLDDAEIMRVLAPGGRCTGKRQLTKPVSDELDV